MGNSVGQFSLFCENRPVLGLTLCYENLTSSLIFFGLVRINQGIKIFNFFNFTGQFLHIRQDLVFEFGFHNPIIAFFS
jgi:hypothetical protein